MKLTPSSAHTARRIFSLALFLGTALCVAFGFADPTAPKTSTNTENRTTGEPEDVVRFRESVGGSITPLVIELKGDPGAVRKFTEETAGRPMSLEALYAHSLDLVAQQEQFRASLPDRGVRALMRETDVKQLDGSIRHIEYRFTYLLNGFVAYVANDDIEKLRALPEVAHISVAESPVYFLDRAIDHSLGTDPSIPARRAAVYGATQEFTPGGNQTCNPAMDPNCHPEAPRTTRVDGWEGQNMNVAVVDTGVDFRHPMFGGIGQGTPLPRISGQPEAPANNKKVIYYYALSSPGDITDDFGHGTHVASCTAGYSVDGNTPPRAGYGIGRDGTGVGPTINNAQLFGTAPQARIMAYKVCGPANTCPGDVPLAVEDAASPFTLVSSGNPGPMPVAKPVADVINLSLGSTTGDPAAANSRAVNNAALAGTIVVASAGNSGPGRETVGNPGAATMAIAVAATLDPGSVAGSDVLAPNQIPGETRTPATPGPSPEMGSSSNANAPQGGERQGMRIFPVAGGGPLPVESTPAQPETNTGSLSAHYVFVDRRNAAEPIPTSIGNRIALVKFTGAFAGAANALAAQPIPPSAILLISNTESATAVQVIRGIPTFTINENDGNYLIDKMLTGDPGDGDPTVDVPPGTISELPLRLAETISLPAFQGVMAGFSSRGPSDHPNASYRVVKPDVGAPGVGVVGAATVEGTPEETVGMASTSGYISANGTSFSSPITAGAMTLIRQRVREELNLDSTDPMQRLKRFDTVTVSRALLQNTATNLRNGNGTPQGPGPASVGSINDMGSGHINISEALSAQAIMVAPTRLLVDANATQTGNQSEFNPPTVQPFPAGEFDQAGNLRVLLPTASYGEVPVVRLNDTIVRTQEVIIRDISTNGSGGGTYNLAVVDNRNTTAPGFAITLTATADSTTPITTVNVPAGGQASYFVRVAADGQQLAINGEEFQWYVIATHNTSTKQLRMPFFYRAITAALPNSAAPLQTAPSGNEPPPAPQCPRDTNGNFTVNWTYTGPALTRFRVQEATFSNEIFFDPADEPLMPNVIGTTAVSENTRWRDVGLPGTPQTPPQWVTQVNPDTGSPAYYIPNGQGQNHSLTMRNKVNLPATGVTLTFTTRHSITTNTNFGFVEVSADDANWFPLLRVTGGASATYQVDLSGLAGQPVRVRFRLQTATGTVSGAQGWWVENIRITSDDFATISEPPANATSQPVTGRPNGTYLYRIAALYANPNPLDPGTIITGPYSNIQCVTVSGVVGAVSRKIHGPAGAFDIQLPFAATPPIPGMRGIEPRSGGTSRQHTIVFQFPEAVTSADNAMITGQSGAPAIVSRNAGPGPNEYTVTVENIDNVQTVMVTLVGVRNSSGTSLGNFTAPMGVLLGDANGNGAVTASDISEAKALSGQVTTADTFRNDVNVNGVINTSDISTIKSASGTTLP